MLNYQFQSVIDSITELCVNVGDHKASVFMSLWFYHNIDEHVVVV